MTAAAQSHAPQRFSHEAFLYASPADFLEGTSAFVRDGLERDQAILVALTGDRARWMREFFVDEPDVRLVDMAWLGANPARIIPAWREFLNSNTARGRSVRGIGEPIWAGRRDAEIAECAQHESLLNLAFDDGPAWRLLCPYDVSALPRSVVERARANHPVVVSGGVRSDSATYEAEAPGRALRGEPLPQPAGTVTELAFGPDDLGSVRELVHRSCDAAGVLDAMAEDLTLSVDEIATNSLLHGGGSGVLRIWVEDAHLVAEVSDAGVIRDQLVGRHEPALEGLGGRGVWLANQLCDLVQVRSGAAGTVVRMHLRIT
ncbi:MAG: anti-sigma factor RsbA family regulatory protein [Actinomycetes bacterium]